MDLLEVIRTMARVISALDSVAACTVAATVDYEEKSKKTRKKKRKKKK